MLIDAMVHFRRAKSEETLEIMFHGWLKKHDLKLADTRRQGKPSYQEMAEAAHAKAKGVSEEAALKWFNTYFAALAAAHRKVEIMTGRTQDFVIDRLVIGRNQDAEWIVEAREIAFREALNQFDI